MNAWGERIKAAREAANLTQEQLGEKLGVTGVTIMRYEKNQRQPRIEQLGKIAKALDISVSEMMGNDWDGWSKMDVSADFDHYSALSDTYYHAVVKWSEDKFFTAAESTAIRKHFSELLIRYKNLVEETSESKTELKKYLKAVEPFYAESDSPPSTQELAEQFLTQKLKKRVEELDVWINTFILHLSQAVADESIVEDTSTDAKSREVEKWEVEEYRHRLLSEQSQLEQEKKPTPVTRDGQDKLEEFVRKHKVNLTEGQRQQVLEMMQAMITPQKSRLLASAQEKVDGTSPKTEDLDQP